jgi:hypothetical protein
MSTLLNSISNLKSQISNSDSPSAPSLPAIPLPHQNGELWGNSRPRSFNLTDLQLSAIDHTLRGVNDSRIAEILDIDRKTLWNWKTFNEDYRRALAEGRAALHAAVIDHLQPTAARAIDTLEDLLDDSDSQIRLRAAQTALRYVAALKPIVPDHQYHSSQSLHVGIITQPPPCDQSPILPNE